MIFEQLVDCRYRRRKRVVFLAAQSGFFERLIEHAADLARVIQIRDKVVERRRVRRRAANPRVVLESNVGQQLQCLDDFAALQTEVSPVTEEPEGCTVGQVDIGGRRADALS